MTGTIYNLSRSQQLDVNSKVIAGALLYIYAAGTTTPADTFTDFLLTQKNPYPVEADASGRFPAIWVPDGAYRARMTNANAILIFDDDNIQAIGPSTGTPVGPGIDPTSVRLTGDFFWLPIAGTRSGAVRANARTIGSVASGATERANADTQPLYEFLWNNFTDALCPVSGGRGASAVIDFNANKAIGTYDMRGKKALGLDTMGNSAAGIAPGVTVAGLTGGASTSAALLAHTHGAGTFAAGAHSHGPGTFAVSTALNPVGNYVRSSTTAGSVQNTGGPLNGVPVSSTVGVNATLASGVVSGTSDPATPSVTGASASAGSGASFDIMNPYSGGTWYIKL